MRYTRAKKKKGGAMTTEFQSAEKLLEVVRLEYQNEINRTSIIDTKTGITLPIVATYFFLVLQFRSIRDIFGVELKVKTTAELFYELGIPVIYICSIVCALFSLVWLFRVVISSPYEMIDPVPFNDKKTMSQPENIFAAAMVTYYIRALEKNHSVNDRRVILYKQGWTYAIISLSTFFAYVILAC